MGVPDPLFEIRTNESPFVAELERGDVSVLKMAIECLLWNFEEAAGFRDRHQLALGSLAHHSTSSSSSPAACFPHYGGILEVGVRKSSENI